MTWEELDKTLAQPDVFMSDEASIVLDILREKGFPPPELNFLVVIFPSAVHDPPREGAYLTNRGGICWSKPVSEQGRSRRYTRLPHARAASTRRSKNGRGEIVFVRAVLVVL